MSTQTPGDDQNPESLYKDRWTVPHEENGPGGLPDSALPEVQPPSAGFIVQLFVVPAVIVLIIVAVYVLFGRLASGEADCMVQSRGPLLGSCPAPWDRTGWQGHTW